MKKAITLIGVLTLALLPGIGLADTLPFPEPSDSNLPQLGSSLTGGPKDVISFLEIIANWFFAILITISVIYILIAAFNYMSGNQENVSKAHRMMLYAAVGIAVAVLARGIVFAVRKLVDSDTRPTAMIQIHHDHYRA